MRKLYHGIIYSLVLALCGCSSNAEVHLAKAELKGAPNFSFAERTVNTYKEFLVLNKDKDLRKENENFLYSPLSFYFVYQLNNYFENNASLEELKSFASQTNVSDNNKFSFSCFPAVASTNDFDEQVINDLNSNYVSAFSGSINELSKSLSSFYGRKISLANNGRYLLSEVSVDSQFYLPLTVKGKDKFYGSKTSTVNYVSGKSSSSYQELDDCYLFDININKVELRVLLPKENKSTKDFDFSYLNQELQETARINYTIPEFSIENNLDLTNLLGKDNGTLTFQNNSLKFNRYGIKASSFTVNGPTASDPTIDIEVKIDRPFMFSLNYLSTPLFYGEVNHL